MLCAIAAKYTEIQGTASGVFLCGMRPLHAGCDGLFSVAISMAEETGQLAQQKQNKNKTMGGEGLPSKDKQWEYRSVWLFIICSVDFYLLDCGCTSMCDRDY